MKVRSLRQSFAPHSWCFGQRSVFFLQTKLLVSYVNSNTSMMCCSNYLRQENGEGNHQKGWSDNHVDSYNNVIQDCSRSKLRQPLLYERPRARLSPSAHPPILCEKMASMTRQLPVRISKLYSAELRNFWATCALQIVGIDKKWKKSYISKPASLPRLKGFETETCVMYTCCMNFILFTHAKV